MSSAPDLHIALRASSIERRFYYGLHGFVVPLPWLADLPVWLKLALSFVLLLFALRYLRAKQRPYSEMHFVAEDIRLQGLAGEVSCRLLPGSFVHTWLIVLRLRDERGRRFPLVIWPDAAHVDDLRRLRVRLQWAGGEDQSGKVQ